MFFKLLENNDFGYNKELNIDVYVLWKGIINHRKFKYICGDLQLFDKLLNILNTKITASTLKLKFEFPNLRLKEQ